MRCLGLIERIFKRALYFLSFNQVWLSNYKVEYLVTANTFQMLPHILK